MELLKLLIFLKMHNVLIIGAGNIGALFDSPESNHISSHAHAIKKSVNFNLVGFVDSDKVNLGRACSLWSVNGYEDIKSAFDDNRIDIVTIASSSNSHYQIFKEISKFDLKLIFIEKPLAKKIADCNDMIRISIERKIPVLVNYSRRFIGEFYDIKNQIKNNVFGKFINGTGYYGKGLVNNGTHMLDFLGFIFDKKIKKIATFQKINDFFEDDPSVSAKILIEDCGEFNLNIIDSRNYSIFEMELFFEKARIKFLNSFTKLEFYFIDDKKIFSGYKKLSINKVIDINYDLALLRAYENIDNYLFNKSSPLICTINDGAEVLKTAINISNE
jgi:predicted dehydrogenase